ncbi:hypothetical protein [Chryseobacterium indoltheticum]|uniref:hypothetical protein n=1 Tax=Chryseobacterium indoltheticum TaxID=254 RepID=UPI003F490A0C
MQIASLESLIRKMIKKYIEDLKTNYNFDLSVSSNEATTQSKSSKQVTSLDEQKGNITLKKKGEKEILFLTE